VLVKFHSRAYENDFGMLVKGKRPYVHLFESGVVHLTSKMSPVPVIRVNARWMDKDVRVSCNIADTDEKKKAGLQPYKSLGAGEGLYFPYPGYSDVTFHQGSVGFPLDVIFLKDGCIVGVKENTKVGGKDRWKHEGCDGVIEVNGGFCEKNSAGVDDRLAFFAFSERDIQAYREDRIAIAREQELRERSENLIHSIVGEEYDFE